MLFPEWAKFFSTDELRRSNIILQPCSKTFAKGYWICQIRFVRFIDSAFEMADGSNFCMFLCHGVWTSSYYIIIYFKAMYNIPAVNKLRIHTCIYLHCIWINLITYMIVFRYDSMCWYLFVHVSLHCLTVGFMVPGNCLYTFMKASAEEKGQKEGSRQQKGRQRTERQKEQRQATEERRNSGKWNGQSWSRPFWLCAKLHHPQEATGPVVTLGPKHAIAEAAGSSLGSGR